MRISLVKAFRKRAGLLMLISPGRNTLKSMSRPEKIYCDNTNLMYLLNPNPTIGTVRETFFANQLRSANHTIECLKGGDFIIDGKKVVEVGGKKKCFTQIKDIPNSFVISDDLEIGVGNRISLLLFGFLY